MIRSLSFPGWLSPLRWPTSAQLLLLAGIASHALLYLSRQPTPDVWEVVWAWLMALGLLLAAAWYFDQEQQRTKPLRLAWTRLDTFAVLCLMGLALLPRLWYLDTLPAAMHNDEAIVGVRAIALADRPLAPLWLPDEMSLTNVWYYSVLPFILLLGRTAAGVRMFAVVAGTLTMATAYWFARLLFSRRVAVVSVALLATFHFHIHFSRLGLSPIVDPLFGTLIFSALIVAKRTQRTIFLVITGAILGFAVNFYTGSRLFIPLLALVGGSWLWQHERDIWRRPQSWLPIALILLGFLVSAGPNLQSAANDPNNFVTRLNQPRATDDLVAESAAQQGWTPLRFWAEQLRRAAFSFFLYPESGYQGFYDNERTILWGLSAYLTAAGALLLLWRWRDWRSQLLLSWYALTVLVGGALMSDPAAQQRYVTLSVVVCLWMALALDQLWRWLALLWPAGILTRYALLTAVLVYFAVTNVQRYFVDYLPLANYGTISSQNASALAHFLRTQPAGTQVMFMGKGATSSMHSHIPRYLAPQVQYADLTRCGDDLATCAGQLAVEPTPPAPPVLVVTASPPPPEQVLIQQQFPNAVEHALRWPTRALPVLYVYQIR